MVVTSWQVLLADWRSIARSPRSVNSLRGRGLGLTRLLTPEIDYESKMANHLHFGAGAAIWGVGYVVA